MRFDGQLARRLRALPRGRAVAAALLITGALGLLAAGIDYATPASTPPAPQATLAAAPGQPPLAPTPAPLAPPGPVAPPTTPSTSSGSTAPAGAAPPPAAVATVSARIRRLLARRPGIATSVAALDLTNSRRYRYPASHTVRIAGVVQLDLLETLLLRRQQAKQQLTDADSATATAMIEHSDNNAADTLWDQLGGAAAFRDANRQLGTKHTSPDIDRYWGLATSDAEDQLALLRNLQDGQPPSSPLDATSRRFAMSLLTAIDPAQAWGVSVAADPGTPSALKNGWVNADDDSGLWAVGSVGAINVRGHRVLLAVLTQHNPSKQAGIDLVQDIAATAVAAVAPTPLPTAN